MRYLPLDNKQRQAMLTNIGVASIDELYQKATGIEKAAHFDLPNHMSEMEVEQYFKQRAVKNHNSENNSSFLGAGYYQHYIPSSVDYIMQRGEFMTAYTPYQPEIAQGTLQYLFEFQSQVATLCGMDIANASMWDGATATAEAILMAYRINRKNKTILSGNLHPHYKEVSKTYVVNRDIEVVDLPMSLNNIEDIIPLLKDDVSSVVVQYPDFLGHLKDHTALSQACKEKGILLIIAFNNILAFGLIKNPGSMGADIVVGEGQSIGVAMSFGGPSLGLFACKKEYLRQIPGRLVGETVDIENKRTYTLTLSTREQHIRRDKATSNICTNSGLCCLAFNVHMTLLGGIGLRKLAIENHNKANLLVSELKKIDSITVHNQTYFNEVLIELNQDASELVEKMLAKKYFAGVPLSRFYISDQYKNLILIATTEMNSDKKIIEFTIELKNCINNKNGN